MGGGPSTGQRGQFPQSPEGYRHVFGQSLAQQNEARAESDQTRDIQSEWARVEAAEELY